MLEVRLSLPRVLGEQNVNYPLQPLDLQKLQASLATTHVAQVLGIRPSLLDWSRFGVRELALTADLVVPEKYASDIEGIFWSVATLPHPGDRVLRDTSVRWNSGTREVQVYLKGAELRHHMGRVAYDRLVEAHPEVNRVIRLEVTLDAAGLRSLFDLRPGWLPMLTLITPETAAYVLVTEVRKHFKLDTAIKATDYASESATAGLVDAILRGSHDLSFGILSQLVVVHQLLSVHDGMSTREFSNRFGVSIAQVGKLRKRLRDVGFPPGSSCDAYAQNCLMAFRLCFLEQYPKHVSKPRLTHEQEHQFTVDAPWLDADDTSRELPGMSVEVYEPEPLCAVGS